MTEYRVYRDGRRLAVFYRRKDATEYADNHSFRAKKVEVNPNIIAPADVYKIKQIKDGRCVSEEVYTASIRIRR